MEARRVLVLLAVVVSLILAGCAPTTAPTMSLNGTRWSLENLQGQAVIPGVQVTLNFEKDTFNGSDGCNQYNGSYTVDGEKISVAENIAATMMACEEPIMAQSSTYIAALRQAAVYKVTDQQLILLDANSKTLATFKQSLEPAGKNP